MEQIAFPMNEGDTYNPDEYIESLSNNLPYDIITKWPKNWGVLPYPKALIIQGAKSSGKTFLAKQWMRLSNALFIKKSQNIDETIINKYQAFIIDGLDQDWDENHLLHYFNMIHEHQKYLLITVTDLNKIKLPDLKSRLKSVNKVNIGKLDDNLMKMIIFKIFSNYSIVISEDVLNFLIKHLPREFSKIIESVKKINDFSLQKRRKVTIPLIKEILQITSAAKHNCDKNT